MVRNSEVLLLAFYGCYVSPCFVETPKEGLVNAYTLLDFIENPYVVTNMTLTSVTNSTKSHISIQ